MLLLTNDMKRNEKDEEFPHLDFNSKVIETGLIRGSLDLHDPDWVQGNINSINYY